MSVNDPIDWDSPDWGKPGHNVHHATTDDLGTTTQPHHDREQEQP